MAERRMVSKVISISEKVNSLSLFGRLLYTWMIPHTDDFGRLPGSPAKVRALVVPMGDETVKDVEMALAEMHKKGLILWYEAEGDRFIQITNFDEHQSGLHKRTKSKFPDPPVAGEGFEDELPVIDYDIPGNSGKFPLEENRTEENRTEQEEEIEKAAATGAQDDFPEQSEKNYESFYAAHERIFGFQCNPFQAEQLSSFIEKDGVEEDVIIQAMKRAALNGTGYKFGLILKIVKDYLASGAKTLPQAIALDNEFDKKKQLSQGRKVVGSVKPKIPIVKNSPTKSMTDEQLRRLCIRTRMLDGRPEPTEQEIQDFINQNRAKVV